MSRVPRVFVVPGEEMLLDGDGLDDEVRAFLRAQNGSETDVSIVLEPDTLRLTIPETRPGVYTLVVKRGEIEDTQPLTVAGVHDERPCRRSYAANTSVSATDGRGSIERFYPDGRRERVDFALSEVEQLEYAYDSELACAAILFRKTDGSALLFEDGAEPLLERAQTLSRYTGKPLQAVP